jgi:hypothetical protein
MSKIKIDCINREEPLLASEIFVYGSVFPECDAVAIKLKNKRKGISAVINKKDIPFLVHSLLEMYNAPPVIHKIKTKKQ